MHRWNVTPKQAIQIQKELAGKIIRKGSPRKVRTIAGCDIAYDPKTGQCFAGVIVFEWPGLAVKEKAISIQAVTFPYVPGLLSFREIPALLAAIRKLKLKPDLFMVDGQGIAHPRRIGLASHLGLWLGCPTIGAAKSRLIGEYKNPGLKTGAFSPLKQGKETIGAVLRTRSGVKPIFVSVGHKIGLKSAKQWVMKTAKGFRVPEPTRQADIYVEKMKRERLKSYGSKIQS